MFKTFQQMFAQMGFKMKSFVKGNAELNTHIAIETGEENLRHFFKSLETMEVQIMEGAKAIDKLGREITEVNVIITAAVSAEAPHDVKICLKQKKTLEAEASVRRAYTLLHTKTMFLLCLKINF